MRRSAILCSGHALPGRTVSNEDLARMIGGDAGEIYSVFGVRERRYVEDDETNVSLCHSALDRALEDESGKYSDIQAIICSTTCADYQFPGNSAFLQERLGLDGCAILDVRNQAVGFLSALQTADKFVASGSYKRILVTGSDVYSPGLDFSGADSEVTAQLADGAGVAVIGPSQGSREILAIATHTDARYAEAFWNPSGSIHIPRFTVEDVDKGDHYIKADWKIIRSLARERLPSVVREVCDAEGIAPTDLAVLLLPQADRELSRELSRDLGLDEDAILNHRERLGDTGAAAVPIAMDETLRSGRVSSGDLLCAAAYGSGFAWGAALIGI